jgi:hypothetical protein
MYVCPDDSSPRRVPGAFQCTVRASTGRMTLHTPRERPMAGMIIPRVDMEPDLITLTIFTDLRKARLY